MLHSQFLFDTQPPDRPDQEEADWEKLTWMTEVEAAFEPLKQVLTYIITDFACFRFRLSLHSPERRFQCRFGSSPIPSQEGKGAPSDLHQSKAQTHRVQVCYGRERCSSQVGSPWAVVSHWWQIMHRYSRRPELKTLMSRVTQWFPAI